MTETRIDRLVNELSKLEKDEFIALIERAEVKYEERKREQLKEAFDAFNESWERIEELGYYPVIPLESGEREISLDLIIWRKVK